MSVQTFPATIGTGTLVGTAWWMDPDSGDVDRAPDFAGADTVTVDITYNHTDPYVCSSPKRLVFPRPISCTFDANGVLLGPDGSPGVVLVDLSDAELSPAGTNYRATVRIAADRIFAFNFSVVAGQTHDLADFALAALSSATNGPVALEALADAVAPYVFGGGRMLPLTADLASIPAGAVDGELAGYVNAGLSSITVAGTVLAPRDYGVWCWDGSNWALAATGALGDPIDSTPPTAGSLAASLVDVSTFTLTVTGAADETALHATPYNYSLDGGTTWTGWQTSAVYNATGRTASTTYTCRHKVRDAAGNESLGSSITVTTAASADTTPPTAPSLSVDNSATTQLVATVTGGTDAVGVTQRRVRIDAGAWQVLADPVTVYTFTGLTAGSAHTIDAQAGDAAGNWSASVTWSGSTAAAAVAPEDMSGLYVHYDLSDSSKVTTSGGNVTAIATAARGASGSSLAGAGVSLSSLTTTGGQLTVGSVNSLPTVRVPTGSKIASPTFPTPQPVISPVTIFHTFKVEGDVAAAGGWYLGGLQNAGITQGGYSKWRIDSIRSAQWHNGTGSTHTVDGGVYVQISTYDSGTVTIYRSGLTGSPVTVTGVSAPIAHYFVEMQGGGTSMSAIQHCQWGVYDRALTAGEVAGLMTHLKAKWGVA